MVLPGLMGRQITHLCLRYGATTKKKPPRACATEASRAFASLSSESSRSAASAKALLSVLQAAKWGSERFEKVSSLFSHALSDFGDRLFSIGLPKEK